MLLAFGLTPLTPGCIRQSMGKPDAAGYTTADDLAGFLRRWPLEVLVEEVASELAQADIEHAYVSGGCTIALGTWLSADIDHWSVSGRTDPGAGWWSDPWQPAHVRRTWATFHGLYKGDLLVIHGR